MENGFVGLFVDTDRVFLVISILTTKDFKSFKVFGPLRQSFVSLLLFLPHPQPLNPKSTRVAPLGLVQ